MILSIESSCDDSSIAITNIDSKQLILHKKISQELDHEKFGGVVPELAARLHAVALPKILESFVLYFDEIKAIAVTTHPGLSVTLNEGIVLAKAMSVSLKLPLISVNHLKGHIYSLFIDGQTEFPLTVLLVSGGHTMIVEVASHFDMKVVATSCDDSFGESFDKVAKMLMLGYPGGPIVEKFAKLGDENSYILPIPLSNSNRIEFSYSGLKNAVKRVIDSKEQVSEQDKYDICASFQKVAIMHIIHKCKQYFKVAKPKKLAIVGGASANLFLRGELEKLANLYKCDLLVAPMEFCSDNAAMIGRCATEDYLANNYCNSKELVSQTKSGNCL